ncbi:Quinohemoprotein alcohol dehydrogenase ADH IIB [Frondihabitans sp. 762G35]|uniref:outer membrane protein assembly factor BamB family protein n=1 Tax=Frondihabitans sp. 762G35 TaxID=1446794 RepID=UPI000D2228CC|nr:PQQ-binding-like beta-propeller repeat protein [Frondihabitans sp. 762G35]ARC58385.1 Quinohemoprotein alcohol dehydrogenase ADH IIB [Frondihabitans sp. 762G35]
MTGDRIHWNTRRRVAAGLTTLAATALLATVGALPATGASSPPIQDVTTWAGYHADQARTGAIPANSGIYPSHTVWNANLGGAVYGQPVVASGRVYAATENDRVVALDPASGKIIWSRSVGTPLTNVAATAGCGNVDPLGITSTPVVDTRTGTLYVVAERATHDANIVQHRLVGMSLATGAVTLQRDVDPTMPAGEKQVNLLQRTGLALANGRVYVGFGGNNGDCGSYHGWVVSAATSGDPALKTFEVASDGEGGAIWMAGGAPAVDAAGNVYVTTGNANPDPPQGGPDPKLYTESVVKLSPDLRVLASYKDRIAGGDADLSTGNPVLLSGGRVFSVGKTDVAYVLRQSDLTQVESISGVCGSDPDGGPAYDQATDTVFVPCRGGGIQPVDLKTKTVRPKLTGVNGAPILVGTQIWAAQYPQGTLSSINSVSGSHHLTITIGSTLPHFATPSAGLRHLFIGTTTGVAGFH